MEKKISATEAVRRFSEILNSVLYKGSHYKIIRGGKPVASISPVTVSLEEMTLGQLKSLLHRLPKLGDEAGPFEKDLRATRAEQPSLPETSRWE